MKFIYAIIPFVNLATNGIVGGASHALHKIVIATPQRGTCHDNKIIPGATTLRVDSPTVINDTPPAKQRKFAQDLPVGHADNAYEACDNLLHKLDHLLVNTFEQHESIPNHQPSARTPSTSIDNVVVTTHYEPFDYGDDDEYEELEEFDMDEYYNIAQLQYNLDTAEKMFRSTKRSGHVLDLKLRTTTFTLLMRWPGTQRRH